MPSFQKEKTLENVFFGYNTVYVIKCFIPDVSVPSSNPYRFIIFNKYSSFNEQVLDILF